MQRLYNKVMIQSPNSNTKKNCILTLYFVLWILHLNSKEISDRTLRLRIERTLIVVGTLSGKVTGDFLCTGFWSWSEVMDHNVDESQWAGNRQGRFPLDDECHKNHHDCLEKKNAVVFFESPLFSVQRKVPELKRYLSWNRGVPMASRREQIFLAAFLTVRILRHAACHCFNSGALLSIQI